MAILDWNGTYGTVIGYVFDWNGHIAHDIKIVDDWDGVKGNRIFTRNKKLIGDGADKGRWNLSCIVDAGNANGRIEWLEDKYLRWVRIDDYYGQLHNHRYSMKITIDNWNYNRLIMDLSRSGGGAQIQISIKAIGGVKMERVFYDTTHSGAGRFEIDISALRGAGELEIYGFIAPYHGDQYVTFTNINLE